jgi:hypothetical protein
LDENLDNCKPITDALVEHRITHERHRAYFERGTFDEVWLPFVADRGWAVLTKDKRNGYNDLEREAVSHFRVREFYFGSGNFTGAEMAATLVAALPHTQSICRSETPPVVCSVTKSDSLTIGT